VALSPSTMVGSTERIIVGGIRSSEMRWGKRVTKGCAGSVIFRMT
jgi:hypothetical protein